jgi:long-chain fatty acid transport protein
MGKIKLGCLILMISAISGNTAKAGGLLTNTNQNIAWNRNMARDGVIAIDGVYSNPAGVAFMSKGLHLSFNFQNVYQTRTIESGINVPSLQGTPFYQPFKLNGGNENGVKTFKGEASVPIVPSFQAALNYDKWGFQASFALTGGGGKGTFNDGLGSFERQVAMIPALLYSQGITSSTPSYGVSSYVNGKQYVYGIQFGTTYKINEHMAVYGGFRFNYIWNNYEGNIINISANIDGNNENLYAYFGDKATAYNIQAAAATMMANEATDEQTKAKYKAIAAQYAAGAAKMDATKEQFADKYLDCTQRGWGITPVIGFDYKNGKWNFGTRLEFTTHLNIENHTKRDDTGLFQDGVNTPNDLPGIFTVGGQYAVLPSLRVMASYHFFFDKDAQMAGGKQKLLSGNTKEYLAGAEWDLTKHIMVSAGVQSTRYGLGDGSYLNDISFSTSSYSIGFGAKIRVAKKASLNVAYFWTTYEKFNKSYSTSISGVTAECTDNFTRTNKVLGVGLDIDL